MLGGVDCEGDSLRIKAGKRKDRINPARTYRNFRVNDVEFLAECAWDDQNHRCAVSFMWPVFQGDTKPQMLYIEYPTAKERQDFEDIARHLGWTGSELGLALVREFAAKFKRRRLP